MSDISDILVTTRSRCRTGERHTKISWLMGACTSTRVAGEQRAYVLARDDRLLLTTLRTAEAMYFVFDTQLQCMVYASQPFRRFTGLNDGDLNRGAAAHNVPCKFVACMMAMCGAETLPNDLQRISDAVEARTAAALCILNYKRDQQTRWWNHLLLKPLYAPDGQVVLILAFCKVLMTMGAGMHASVDAEFARRPAEDADSAADYQTKYGIALSVSRSLRSELRSRSSNGSVRSYSSTSSAASTIFDDSDAEFATVVLTTSQT